MSDTKKSHSNLELDVLKYWDENQIFEKSVEMRPQGKPYVFYDGPPFATGLPHYGHLVGSVMKDVVPRYQTMRGFRVERKWGWDCHGLPIENIVEKKFELNSKKDIEAFGVDVFNNKCHAEVLTYAEEWKKVIHRLGRWVDMESAYKTMDLPFMESIWWVFKSLWEKDFIYEGRKPMHICPRCETVLSNFEVNQGYQDVTDISVTAKFKLTSGKYAGVSVLAWTTTPWTLPGNVLLAVGEKINYVLAESSGEQFILAQVLADKVLAETEYKILEPVAMSELVGATYEPLFSAYADHTGAFRVVTADFVTTEGGTGVVHIAPGFGEDDMHLGLKERVAPIMHVGMDGHFVREVMEPLVEAGYDVDRPVKTKEDNQKVDIEIIKYLAHQGKLFAKKKLVHSYPHCWRCETPLLNYSTSSWFVNVTKIKERMVLTNKEINWVPGNMKEGRFGKWLEGARDWAISRSRYWGTPLPIWQSEDGEVICVGSAAQLEELSGVKVDNLHKHVIDNIVIERDGKKFTRIKEVLDCWFESGSMPYAQLHYPFENESKFEQGFPAEFIAEGQDQTRGWFYTLHVLANALFEMPAFKNVIVNGIVLAEDGKKMSKRLQNYPDPMTVMERYGSDAVRYYLMSSPVVHAENISFSEKGVDEVAKKYINILNNVTSFYALYKDADDGREPALTNVLDRWVVSRLNETLEEQTEAMELYSLQEAARVLQSFLTDLSTWYVRRSRDRFKVEGEDKLEALATLRMVLDTFAKMAAPFTPFIAEMVYQEVQGGFLATTERKSVHLEDWPEVSEIDTKIIAQMGEARAIVSRALDIREESGRAIKQVLSQIFIQLPSGEIDPEILAVILDEVNVKNGEVTQGELNVELNLELTADLVREGMVRDITRQVNGLRKEANLTLEDRIELKIWSASPEVKLMFEEHADKLSDATLSASVNWDKVEDVGQQKEFRVAEQEVWVGF
ncbi:isoleucine--tRNA ligase [Candidatus Uhrbacteria bacterium CG_4_9_14_3_um_filter_41_35]|uniref:Isoleucine--tRNA ligase n=1 Tax=Candidatus Uhrbacteria bacterium CG_4_9_14_3_um_filter_41_35 TaxID=1975034 RepID=A0A2M7XGD0_9BACT|nr:MAG: isoleucine--tRNA ligase [Candidatus Uhrbacteria bacterium CG11_big_fil_rev_8_21_14_0_20_41_9]PJA46950.1 MAG: isoleucine--tRNA ligase [Candidatus Uhrbacteria bacterium CG_4_9_14_3_um_filter_41_35]